MVVVGNALERAVMKLALLVGGDSSALLLVAHLRRPIGRPSSGAWVGIDFEMPLLFVFSAGDAFSARH